MMNQDTLPGFLLWGDFGLLTMTPAYLIGLLLPVMVIFHFLTSCLDESGLFHRCANKLEKPLCKIGLSGRSLISMIMGFGCVTAALASLSVLQSKRERRIASTLLCIIIPCSAQTAIVIAMAFYLSPRYFALYVSVILLTFFSLSVFLNFILPKEMPGIGMPSGAVRLQWPPFYKILKKSIGAGIAFTRETAPSFIIGSLCISLLHFTNHFAALSARIAPITQGFLHLPKEASDLFILSLIKRDLGVAGLLSIIKSGSFTEAQLTVCLTIMTLFVPCFASLILLFKQETLLTAISIWVGSLTISMMVGRLVSFLIL